MDYEQLTYTYYRSKSIIEDEELGKVFVGFVSISILKEQITGNIKRQKLTKGPAFLMDCSLEEAPIQLLKLPKKDTKIILTQPEYELLEKSAEKEELAFWLYRTAIS